MPITPLLVCHRSGDLELYLGAGARIAPEIESRTDSLCPLAHSRDAEMAGGSAGSQYRGVNSLTIVPDTYPELIL